MGAGHARRPGGSARATRSRPGAPCSANSAAAAASRSSSFGTTTGSLCWWQRCSGRSWRATLPRRASSPARPSCCPARSPGDGARLRRRDRRPVPAPADRAPRGAHPVRPLAWPRPGSRSSSCCRWVCTSPRRCTTWRPRAVHLDVKPDNIVMGAPPRLIDLSVARSLDEAAGLQSRRHRRLYGARAIRAEMRRWARRPTCSGSARRSGTRYGGRQPVPAPGRGALPAARAARPSPSRAARQPALADLLARQPGSRAEPADRPRSSRWA